MVGLWKRTTLSHATHLLPETSTSGFSESPEDEDEEGRRPVDQVQDVRDQVDAGKREHKIRSYIYFSLVVAPRASMRGLPSRVTALPFAIN